MNTTLENTTTDLNAGHGVVLFDGSCRFCQFGVKMVQRLDWLKRLRYQDMHDQAAWPPSEVPLDPAKMMEEMHLVTPDRKRLFAGFTAFRWMAGRLPLTWLLTPFLYLPGVRWIGQKMYMWIARNRYNLVPCKDGVCQIPAKKG